MIRYAFLAALACAGAIPAIGSAADPFMLHTDADAMRTIWRWPYRAFLPGLDAFDRAHDLAPNGVLTFALRPPATQADNVNVALDGRAGHLALPLDGMRFTLPRIDRFDRRDTLVIVTARDTRPVANSADTGSSVETAMNELGSLPVADVRTPGLPDGVFRMGDLRLACKVSTAVLKDRTPWWFNALLSGVLRNTDWCDGANSATFSPRAARRFVALTMRDGAREQRLTFDKPRDRLPLPSRNQGWGDETLLTIEPASSMISTPPRTP